MRLPIGETLVLLAALVWTAVISLSGSFDPAAALLVGVGLLVVNTVSIVGMVVNSARWARRLAFVGLGMSSLAGAFVPVDNAWLAAMAITAIAAAYLFRPSVSIRRLPSATGPPTRAVLIPLVLIVAPYLYGLAGAGSQSWALLVSGLSAPLAGFLYAGVRPGGLLAVRLAWPALAVVLVPFLEPVAVVASLALAGLVAGLAWSAEAKTAFHPPRETGSAYPIPPELSPREILDAANIDERGRPR